GRDRRQRDGLADEPPPGLLEHQGKLGEAEAEAVCVGGDKDAKPPELPRLPQSRRREGSCLRAKPARHLSSRRPGKSGRAIAPQRLLRCQLQVHDSPHPAASAGKFTQPAQACPPVREGSTNSAYLSASALPST